MGLLTTLRRPVRGFFLLRRVLVELRGIRRALERQADVLELAHLREGGQLAGRTFRGYSRDRAPADHSDVSYVDPNLAGMLQIEGELKALLGRDPTEDELSRAFAGNVE